MKHEEKIKDLFQIEEDRGDLITKCVPGWNPESETKEKHCGDI